MDWSVQTDVAQRLHLIKLLTRALSDSCLSAEMLLAGTRFPINMLYSTIF
jgi:hypothetical protein